MYSNWQWFNINILFYIKEGEIGEEEKKREGYIPNRAYIATKNFLSHYKKKEVRKNNFNICMKFRLV